MRNEIYFELGLGTRMRRLIEAMSAGMERLYDELGVDFRTGSFYAVYAVVTRGPLTINEIVALSGFSQSAVSQTIKRLVTAGYLETLATADGRQKLVALSKDGERLVEKMRPAWDAMEAVVKDGIAESGVDFMAGLAGIEAAFERQCVYDRLQEKLAATPAPPRFTVENYDARWRQAFYDHNARWLEEYFEVEPVDVAVMSDPEGTILAKGGEIFFAVAEGEALGTVALKMTEPGIFELTKLGVDPNMQQGGMGRALCEKVIERFIARGGKTLYLETNTKLAPAINLYKKLDFVEKPNPYDSPYERSNYYMEWEGTR